MHAHRYFDECQVSLLFIKKNVLIVGTSLLDEIPTLGNTKENITEAVQSENVRQYLTNCTYLEDESIELYGLKMYGTPWQPEFCKWAFNVPRGEACLQKWNNIPAG